MLNGGEWCFHSFAQRVWPVSLSLAWESSDTSQKQGCLDNHVSMGHNLRLHFWVDEHPFATYFDVHHGYRVLTHSHVLSNPSQPQFPPSQPSYKPLLTLLNLSRRPTRRLWSSQPHRLWGHSAGANFPEGLRGDESRPPKYLTFSIRLKPTLGKSFCTHCTPLFFRVLRVRTLPSRSLQDLPGGLVWPLRFMTTAE